MLICMWWFLQNLQKKNKNYTQLFTVEQFKSQKASRLPCNGSVCSIRDGQKVLCCLDYLMFCKRKTIWREVWKCIVFDWTFVIVCIFRCDSLVAPQMWNECGRTLAIEWVDYLSFLYDEIFETYFQLLWYIQCILIDIVTLLHNVTTCPFCLYETSCNLIHNPPLPCCPSSRP